VDEATVSLLRYDALRLDEQQIERMSECFYPADDAMVTWINVVGLHEVAILQDLGDCFGFHPLVLEDILNTEQRAKLEDFGDYVLIVLKSFKTGGDGDIESEQVSVILGPNYVISFQEKQGDGFLPVRQRLQSGAGRVRRMGPDYLAYLLLDIVVDGYFDTLEGFGDSVEMLEEQLLADPSPQTLQQIHYLKQRMIQLRRGVWPLREVIGSMERGESPLIQDSTHVYLRDLYDHTIQVMDVVESYRDMLSSMLDVYLSSVSNTMNAVMKVLTIIGTIFIPLTFIAGIYGMNFRYMPELEARWGYPAVLVVMLVMVGAMLIYFKRRRWL
jgi:magnesium transporter